jgi:hypothetical protein
MAYTSVFDPFVQFRNVIHQRALTFFLFCFFTIETILIWYVSPMNTEWGITLVLGILWLMFWTKADTLGKLLLLISAAVGFSHEVLGVGLKWFSYSQGMVAGVPLWLLPGYGVIYYSAEYIWKKTKRQWTDDKYIVMSIVLVGFFLYMDIYVNKFIVPISQWFYAGLILLLVSTLSKHEQHFMYAVAVLTATEEYVGVVVKAWTYPMGFAFLNVVPSYMFLGWIGLAITHLSLKDSCIITRRIGYWESILAASIIVTWLLTSL